MRPNTTIYIQAYNQSSWHLRPICINKHRVSMLTTIIWSCHQPLEMSIYTHNTLVDLSINTSCECLDLQHLLLVLFLTQHLSGPQPNVVPSTPFLEPSQLSPALRRLIATLQPTTLPLNVTAPALLLVTSCIAGRTAEDRTISCEHRCVGRERLKALGKANCNPPLFSFVLYCEYGIVYIVVAVVGRWSLFLLIPVSSAA